jgi:ATP-dependent RNA helicase RhlE
MVAILPPSGVHEMRKRESSESEKVNVISTGEPRFAALGLAAPLLRAVADEGYALPTPIQAQAIPHVLAERDLLACAQTGTGKTAAFVLPLLQHLASRPRTPKIRTLILTPTRELAAQIAERATAYGRHVGLRIAVIFGGVGQHKQEQELRRGVDLLVATPGRLLDLMSQGLVRLDGIQRFVLDEADRMLDMGFIHDVRRVIERLPRARQTLLFSATFPESIADLARQILRDPVRIDVAPEVTTAEGVEQTVHFVSRPQKRELLRRVVTAPGVERALVFTRTKHGANRVAEQLEKVGIEAAAIHGNKSQGARERALEGFRLGTIPVLVATDIAARGIDVDGVSLVVNYDLPNVPEQYVHRIGRTGRAGAKGRAIAFCEPEERKLLVAIERFIRQEVPVAGGAPPDAAPPVPDRARAEGAAPGTSARRRRRRRYRGVRLS